MENFAKPPVPPPEALYDKYFVENFGAFVVTTFVAQIKSFAPTSFCRCATLKVKTSDFLRMPNLTARGSITFADLRSVQWLLMTKWQPHVTSLSLERPSGSCCQTILVRFATPAGTEESNPPNFGTGRRGHYERGLFAGGISRTSKFSKFSRKWSDSPLFSRQF